MMDERDPTLTALFADKQEEIKDEDFVEAVMARTTALKYRLIASAFGMTGCLLILAILFSVPLMDFAFVISDILGTELIPISNPQAAWLLAPLNNLASVLLIFGKILKTGINRARQATYA